MKLLQAQDANYYYLHKYARPQFEGRKSLFNALWVVGAVILTTAIILALVFIKSADDVGTMIGSGVMATAGLAFLIGGFAVSKKSYKRQQREKQILENCTLTDGQVVSCQCSERVVSSNSNVVRKVYDVQVGYIFYDKSGQKRNGFYKNAQTIPCHFYEGQYLMIAFTYGDSLILNKYTLTQGDEAKLKKAEEARGLDDFDELDGRVIAPPERGAHSAQLGKALIIGGVALCCVGTFVCGLVGGLAIPAFFASSSLAPKIIVCVFVAMIGAIFFVPGGIVLRRGIASNKRFNEILQNNPRYTFGNIFASECTYRDGKSKTVMYTYIDGQGRQIRKQAHKSWYTQQAGAEQKSVIVVYDDRGNSDIVLHL